MMGRMSETAESKPKEKAQAFAKIIVINNHEGMEMIHVPCALPKDKDGKVLNHDPQGPLMVLVPGVNIVSKADLDACRTNPNFESKFSTKIPRHVARECVSERVGQTFLKLGKLVPERAPLSVLDLEEAVEIIEDSNTVELLNLLKAGEGRDTLRAAIDDRIKLIETGGPEQIAQ